ncbi:hypothetical protein Micbo1qcDRAFT_22436 [Microdochium bolleyi]|uniref:Uncharacterized protein n=1 Tax=Microdochium bolleyi TaxID=196109 RepID=A0A136IRG7_9PEZI|nr:hypothetical protein Micbo1qcDRAFT_22436 [Microdochium bolleyi]
MGIPRRCCAGRLEARRRSVAAYASQRFAGWRAQRHRAGPLPRHDPGQLKTHMPRRSGQPARSELGARIGGETRQPAMGWQSRRPPCLLSPLSRSTRLVIHHRTRSFGPLSRSLAHLGIPTAGAALSCPGLLLLLTSDHSLAFQLRLASPSLLPAVSSRSSTHLCCIPVTSSRRIHRRTVCSLHLVPQRPPDPALTTRPGPSPPPLVRRLIARPRTVRAIPPARL